MTSTRTPSGTAWKLAPWRWVGIIGLSALLAAVGIVVGHSWLWALLMAGVFAAVFYLFNYDVMRGPVTGTCPACRGSGRVEIEKTDR